MRRLSRRDCECRLFGSGILILLVRKAHRPVETVHRYGQGLAANRAAIASPPVELQKLIELQIIQTGPAGIGLGILTIAGAIGKVPAAVQA